MSTPRTDAVAHHCTACTARQEVVPADFARQLEMELNACREELAALNDSYAKCAPMFGDHTDYASRAAHLRDIKTPLNTSRL